MFHRVCNRDRKILRKARMEDAYPILFFIAETARGGPLQQTALLGAGFSARANNFPFPFNPAPLTLHASIWH